jgi:hypothetical protein
MNIQRMRKEYELGLKLTNMDFVNSLFNEFILKETHFKIYKKYVMSFCVFSVDGKNIVVYHNLFNSNSNASIFYAYGQSFSPLEFVDLLFGNLSEDKQEKYASIYIQATYFKTIFLEQFSEWIKKEVNLKTLEFLEQELTVKNISMSSSKNYQSEIELNLSGIIKTYIIKSTGTIKEIKFYVKTDRSNNSLSSSLLSDLEHKYKDKGLLFPPYAYGEHYESILFSLLRDLIRNEYKKTDTYKIKNVFVPMFIK